MSAYTGALTRSAHYAFRPPVPGVDPAHEHPHQVEDIFTPEVETPGAQTGDVWQPADQPTYTDMRADRVYHWADLQQAVPSNVHSHQRDIAQQVRMLANHACLLYRPDTYVPYRHAGQGLHIQYVEGRAPQNAGQTVPDDMAYLVMGRNSYDQTNQPNEVYGSGGESNVGRYRLGVRIEDWGLYDNPVGKYGQDAQLRAYTGLAPQFPVDKPPVADPAPYTPPSSGTTRWQLPAFMSPSLWSLPAETSITDYETATEPTEQVSEFTDDGRL